MRTFCVLDLSLSITRTHEHTFFSFALTSNRFKQKYDSNHSIQVLVQCYNDIVYSAILALCLCLYLNRLTCNNYYNNSFVLPSLANGICRYTKCVCVCICSYCVCISHSLPHLMIQFEFRHNNHNNKINTKQQHETKKESAKEVKMHALDSYAATTKAESIIVCRIWFG